MRLTIAMYLTLLMPLLLGGDAPPTRDGQELVGTRMPALTFERWLRTADGKPVDAAGGPVLYRWWTGGCAYCEKSLPTFEMLRKKHAADGLRVVAAYHPKPVAEVSDDIIRTAAAETGFAGAIAVDENWSELKRVWLCAGRRKATSVTFLVDRDGIIRFVHPGPALFPSNDPDDAAENRSFAELERVIDQVLQTPPPK